MTENISGGLENSSFNHHSEIKEWNLDKTELHLEDIQSWFDINENIFCSYKLNVFFVDVLKNIPMHKNITNTENIQNKSAFENFAKNNFNNSQFKDKFVAFVNGEFQDAGYKKNALIKKMYDKFGNVDMYVHKITGQKMVLIDTPEFISH